MIRPQRRLAALAAIVLTAALGACSIRLSGPPGDTEWVDPCPSPATDLEPPDHGVWLGASLQWSDETAKEYADRLGHDPAVLVTFADLPLTGNDRHLLDQAMFQARGVGAMLLVTLEPQDGLASVTDTVIKSVVSLVDSYDRQGVPVLVRFAHEMNGSWYAWGQDPAAYVRTFRRLADAVHSGAPGAAMLWAPNYGGGYPFAGGEYSAKPGTRAFRLLDTNHNGRLDRRDDSYAPYWPGKDYVDWVGMSVYHWGLRYPWGENELPEAGKFVGMLRGTYAGWHGQDLPTPDFYAEYAERYDLPLAVTETAALYVPGNGGADELDLKSRWWDQVYAADLPEELPQLKMINWFEQKKQEVEVHDVVDWAATRSDAVRDRYVDALPAWARWGDDVPHCTD
ncbi:glycoside hydrolase family 26 protein [Nocardioides sp. KR10-350]|uniref:glycoside hydrolase family 26 protein n=1 Tax=Nocardioides cheoyonin TaxID=3156615 RepID=UPI0032B52B4B